ncbi:hypothetical protein D3C80_658220 [compost metagenome]
MIIRINNADFSANNIGEVDIPITYDPDALAYLNAIPVTFAGMTYAKKKAINIFFKKLKSNGIYSKIIRLFLPIFGQSDGGVNLINPLENIAFPTDSSIATYNSKGIYFLKGWGCPFTVLSQDMHAGSYNTTSAPDVDKVRVSIGKSSAEFWLGRRISSSRLAGLLPNPTTPRINFSNQMTAIGPLIGTSKTSITTQSAVVGYDMQTQVNGNYVPTGAINLVLGSHTVNDSVNTQETSYGLFSFGSYLTPSELTAYGQLQINLINVLVA